MAFQKVMILNFPKISLEAPPLAPAILGSICESLSVEYDFIDCNMELHDQLHGEQKEEILERYAERFINELSEGSGKKLNDYFDSVAERCRGFDLIAISVFSGHSVALTHDFLVRCRSKISAKIIIGGSGIKTNGLGELRESSFDPFYQTAYDQKLIDYWVLGEGDEAFRKVLLGELDTTEINNKQFNSLKNFDLVPVPNFDKFRLEKYVLSGKRIAPVEGSRGCVKNCTFCDINQIWGKFKYKDGNKLTEELLLLQKKYNIDHFWFNDSLINGSMKVLREFTTSLAKSKPEGLTWSSQAIIRPKSSRDREDFKALRDSGCNALAVGLESFSERARFHMGKKFTDEDLDSFLNLAQEFGITVILLLIVGYPIETQEDIDHWFRQLERYSYLADDGTISFIRIGNTMAILPNTPISYQLKELDVEFDATKPSYVFWNRANESTLEKRIKWRMDLENHARSLGYNCLDKEMHAEQTLIKIIEKMT